MFLVRCIGIGIRKSAELGLIHRGQYILIHWCKLRLFDGESRIEVLDVQDVPLKRNLTCSWSKVKHDDVNVPLLV